MKIKTLEVIHDHMQSNKIYFRDDAPVCDYHLTDGEIRDIISMEYGIRPKRSRIFKKYLKRLSNDLLRVIIEEIEENGYQAKSLSSEQIQNLSSTI